MKNKIEEFRENYNDRLDELRFVNKTCFTTTTRSICMSNLNKSRHILKAEMKRVSWLLWPETGRPYNGQWAVMSRIHKSHVLVASQEKCRNFVTLARGGYFMYYIERADTADARS